MSCGRRAFCESLAPVILGAGGRVARKLLTASVGVPPLSNAGPRLE